MPLVQTRVFRVRHYECGPHGQVRQPVYLRYAQESAFDASAAAGYDMARYAQMDHLWLARETEVEYIQPLFYGDSVEVKTWVMDFRRVRSRRAYEFRRESSGELVARASTDWVFLRQSTGRPAPIPDAMKAGFFPEGIPRASAAMDRFPPTPVPPAEAARQRRRIEWRDLDPVGHVNNAVYLSFVLSGLDLPKAVAEEPGTQHSHLAPSPAARYHRIEYVQPAILGDKVETTTWPDDEQPDDALRHTLIVRARDGARLARARSILVSPDQADQGADPLPGMQSANLPRGHGGSAGARAHNPDYDGGSWI